MSNKLLRVDCMEYMKDIPDNHFDLGIVDPPYNVGASDGKFGGKKKKPSMISGKINGKHYANHNKTPEQIFFDELFRVSKNQIIWGSNYYPQFLYHSGAVIWDKLTTGPLSDCEIAFQSFNKLVLKYTQAWTGFNKGGDKSIRIHPNQKPVALYKWLLTNYAKPGDKLFDSHSGSGSFRIAAYDMGFDLVSCELDSDYCRDNEARFQNHIKQQDLFAPEETQELIYSQKEFANV